MSSIVINNEDTDANNTITVPATTTVTQTENDGQASINSLTLSPVSYLGDATLCIDACAFLKELCKTSVKKTLTLKRVKNTHACRCKTQCWKNKIVDASYNYLFY